MKETRDTIVGLPEIRESNRKITARVQERQMTNLKESIRRSFKVDLDNEAFKFDDPFFSWTKFREASYKLAAQNMQEANAENTFAQLLRAGVNVLANSWYELVQTNHESVGATTVSTHAIELHAPLHRGQVPRRVIRGDRFPDTKVQGLDIQIVNEKFGTLVGFERELFDDDQTGQIAQRAKDIGENMRILEDAWFFARFIGAASSYAGDTIPASQTYSQVWYVSTSPMTGGGFNAPASYTSPTEAAVQAADIQLMDQLDLLGNKMLVNPNTLLSGTKNKFVLRTLLNSEWYPSSTALLTGGTGGGTTSIGTSFARNVMDGMYNLVVSRFMPTKSVALGEAGKGIIFQRRDALEVIQENPASGMAFTNDIYNFRSRARWEPDWIDPRFWYLINDGSV